MIAGPIGVFIVVFFPFAVFSPSPHGLLNALIGATIAAMILGLPLFGSMAWAVRWLRHKPRGDLNALDNHYRMVERHLAVAGMSALGYLAGCWLTFSALNGESAYKTVFGTMTIVFVVVSFVIVGIVAAAKIGIVKRLEILKAAIQASQEETKGAVEAGSVPKSLEKEGKG